MQHGVHFSHVPRLWWGRGKKEPGTHCLHVRVIYADFLGYRIFSAHGQYTMTSWSTHTYVHAYTCIYCTALALAAWAWIRIDLSLTPFKESATHWLLWKMSRWCASSICTSERIFFCGYQLVLASLCVTKYYPLCSTTNLAGKTASLSWCLHSSHSCSIKYEVWGVDL